jgi:glycosyltransferase involved in cell wall biosynthesis
VLRILCVAGVNPWPATDGYRQRLAALVEGLVPLGDVTLWCYDDGPGRESPDEVPDGVRFVPVRAPQTGAPHRLRTWIASGRPRAMARRQPVAPLPDGAGYDVVVFSHLDAWHHFGSAVDAPAIVDFDNLEDLMIRARRAAGARRRYDTAASWRSRLRGVVADLADRIDEGRFSRMQQECAGAVSRVLLCSDLDVRRSGLANATAVPNGASLRWSPPASRPQVDDPAMLFVGLLSYEPNADAARWFATEVLPEIRRDVPGARFRVVGRGGEPLATELSHLPGVEVVGELDDLEPELRSATLSVVPIRFGAGTRLKVVEAFANRLPVVSTTIGCEGIDGVGGRHLLVADDAGAFSDACVALLEDPERRSALAGEGAALYDSRYRWSAIQERFRELVREVASTRSPSA